jgi:hypothetical protein
MGDLIPPTEGVVAYWRKHGETVWKSASRDTSSRYDGYTALALASTPEVREYYAYGVHNDEQIDQPSDIVTVTFGG